MSGLGLKYALSPQAIHTGTLWAVPILHWYLERGKRVGSWTLVRGLGLQGCDVFGLGI